MVTFWAISIGVHLLMAVVSAAIIWFMAESMPFFAVFFGYCLGMAVSAWCLMDAARQAKELRKTEEHP